LAGLSRAVAHAGKGLGEGPPPRPVARGRDGDAIGRRHRRHVVIATPFLPIEADGVGFGGASRVAGDHAVVAEAVEDERGPGRRRLGRVDLLQCQLRQLPGLRQSSPFLKSDQALYSLFIEASVDLLDAEAEIIEPLLHPLNEVGRQLERRIGRNLVLAPSPSSTLAPSAAGSMAA
jgi:hypothetical protein